MTDGVKIAGLSELPKLNRQQRRALKKAGQKVVIEARRKLRANPIDKPVFKDDTG